MLKNILLEICVLHEFLYTAHDIFLGHLHSLTSLVWSIKGDLLDDALDHSVQPPSADVLNCAVRLE